MRATCEPSPRLGGAAVGKPAVVCAAWPVVVPQVPESGLQPCARVPAPVPPPIPVPVPVPPLALVLPLAPGLALVPVLVLLEALALGLTGVDVLAPPVAVLHCNGPCLSQAGGIGSFTAKVLVPFVENVGLWQPWICAPVVFGTWLPGIFCNCWKPASTRLIGRDE